MAKPRAPHCKPADVRAAVDAYRALHDGLDPTAVDCVKWDAHKPRFEVELGPMPENRYIKKHVENDEPRKDVFRHFNFEDLQKTNPALAEEYMPVLVHNDRGEMRIEQSHRGRNYTVTSHGIEDLPMHNNGGYGLRRNGAAEDAGYQQPVPGGLQSERGFFTDMSIIVGWAGGITILGAMLMKDTTMSHAMKAALTGVVGLGSGIGINQRAPRIALGLASGGGANLLQALFEKIGGDSPKPTPPVQTSVQHLEAAVSAPLPSAPLPVQLNAPEAIAPAGHVSSQGINLMMRGRRW
jgi:hypothetical protein